MYIRNISLLLACTSLALAAPSQSQEDRSPRQSASCGYWPGFANVKNIFAFGDSYTATGFNISGTQPKSGNPTGNPSFPGKTSCNGPNWLEFLVARYNASEVMTYNLAYAGATIDKDLARPIFPKNARSLHDQIREDFLPTYGSRGLVKAKYRDAWGAENTLFSVFIGVNDVIRTHGSVDKDLMSNVFDEYEMLLGELYNSGARNFLLMDVPPVEDSPLVQMAPGSILKVAKAVEEWDSHLEVLSKKFKASHSDAMVTLFSTNKVFTAILEDPRKFKQTQDMTVADPEYCSAYDENTPNMKFVSGCKAPAGQYFWLNKVHPTSPVHDALAFQVSRHLENIKPLPRCF